MNNEVYIGKDFSLIMFYKTIISNMVNAYALHKILFDHSGKPCDYEFLEVNPSFESITNLKKDDIIGKKVSDVIPNILEDEVDWIEIYGNVAKTGKSISFESYFKPLDKWYTINAYSPKKDYFVTVFSDMSNMKKNELDLREKNAELFETKGKLQYLESHDYLTGLPNRVSLYKNTKMELENLVRSNMALLYIDFDNFKFINNTLGHLFGEKLIVEMCNRLSSLFHRDHKIYRLDNAEFVLCLYDFNCEDEVKVSAERIIQCFETPIIIEGNRIYTPASIGIATYPDQGNSAEELLRNADIGMKISNNIGKNRVTFYNEAMEKKVAERLIIEKHLYSALENHEFEIYYQPQLDLTSNEISGYEALLRWRNPTLGSVSPEVFISVAESTQLIIPIGEWVLRNACYFIKKLQNKGHIDFTVSVNVSVIQLLQDDYVDQVLAMINLIDLNPNHLELEITESIIFESYDAVINKLEHLRKNGIKIAMDDFGKGFSSLSNLQNLPIDILKIDKIFIDSILNRDKCICITDMIIMLGRKLGLTVVAEGVETEEQMDYLIEHQCHRMQGYLFSKPLTENEILDNLHKKAKTSPYIYGFEWKDEYSIHIDVVDAQHKRMFEIGNKLSKLVFSDKNFNDNKKLSSILLELKHYTEDHFEFEERYMLANGYLYLEYHANEHRLFIEKVEETHKNINKYMGKDNLIYLIDMVSEWIINHILKEDMKFGDSLSSGAYSI